MSEMTLKFKTFIGSLPLANRKKEVKELKDLMNYFALAFTGKNLK
jgi:hypothetical protein